MLLTRCNYSILMCALHYNTSYKMQLQYTFGWTVLQYFLQDTTSVSFWVDCITILLTRYNFSILLGGLYYNTSYKMQLQYTFGWTVLQYFLQDATSVYFWVGCITILLTRYNFSILLGGLYYNTSYKMQLQHTYVCTTLQYFLQDATSVYFWVQCMTMLLTRCNYSIRLGALHYNTSYKMQLQYTFWCIA